jgi:spermidine synthase
MRRLIAILAAASGLCGIAYELLYARLLTTYLGDMFHVGASILAAFLLGIAAGSFVAHRFSRWLWAVEIGIGAYAIGLAVLFDQYGRQLQEAWLPVTASSPAALVACVMTLLLIPAILIGFSVPLFTLLARDSARDRRRDAFRSVYQLYNAGAAACVLFVEFVVLRELGIRDSLLFLAAVNCGCGLLLWRIQRQAPVVVALFDDDMGALPNAQSQMAALFAVSVLSGIYQMFLYKIAEMIFGPFHENFAIVLALVLTGIVVGSYVVGRRSKGFDRWLIDGSIAVSLALLSIAPLVWFWAFGNGVLGAVPVLSTGLKIAVLGMMSAVPLAVFGGTIPALLRDLPESRSQAGRALAVSSLGNCLGYLLMVLWLYAAVSDRVLAVGLSAGLFTAGLLAAQGSSSRPGIRVAMAGGALAALAFLWPSSFLNFGYDNYTSLKTLAKVRSAISNVDIHRRFDSQISLLRTASGSEVVIINGYSSLISSAGERTNLREMIYGLTPALFATKFDRALVLGVGTGITAAATASVFEHTVAVEVNPSMLSLLPRWEQHNLSISTDPRVELVLDDGLSALLRSDQHFDAIVNTVTSPLYFSSSKLYTREFFDLVSERLADGGVYTLWFDGRVTEPGARVIFETLAESFESCAFTYLDTTYLQLLCANQPLEMRNPASLSWDDRIRERISAHDIGLELEEILRALVFPGRVLSTKDWGAPINTFDRPTLEFMMASRRAEEKRWWSPYALLEIDVTASPGKVDPIFGFQLAKRCYLLRVLQYSDISDCLERIRSGERGDEAIADYADRISTYEVAESTLLHLGERFPLVDRLISIGALDSAERLLENVEVTPRIRGQILIFRAQLRLAREGLLTDAEIGELYTAAPLESAAREIIVRALAARGDRSAALAHARFLPLLGMKRENTAALMEQLELIPTTGGDS